MKNKSVTVFLHFYNEQVNSFNLNLFNNLSLIDETIFLSNIELKVNLQERSNYWNI